MRVAMLAFVMLPEYPEGRTSRLPASDRRSSPRALCMLQPPLGPSAWEPAALAIAGMGEPIDPPTLPRSRRAPTRPTCLSGQTECIVQWLLECRRTRGRTGLRLDSLRLGGRVPRLDSDLDIPIAEQRRLLQVWSRGDALTHFQRLGMVPTTDPLEIRRAYLATCQRLHPDRYYGRRIGPFAGVLVDLFHRTHAAQAFLADPQRCARYLRELAAAGHRIELEDATPVVLRAPSQPTHVANLLVFPTSPRPPSR